MADFQQLMAQHKNRVSVVVRERGHINLGDGCTLTWSSCSNPQYPSPRFKFVNLLKQDEQQSCIYDIQTGALIEPGEHPHP